MFATPGREKKDKSDERTGQVKNENARDRTH